MDDTRDVTQNGQQDVDEEVGIATSLKEDTKRRENDGKDDLADVAVASMLDSNKHGPFGAIARMTRIYLPGCERHVDGMVCVELGELW